MKQNKLVIVGLVVIAVLFVIGLGTGLFNAQNPNNDWVATLERFMSPFDSKLDPARLIPLNNCKIDQSTHRLTLTRNKPECNFKIAAQDEDTVQKAVLSVKTGNVKLQVPCPKDKASATSTRGTRVSFTKFKQPKAKVATMSIKPGKVQAGSVISKKLLTLDVIYTPAGAKKKSKMCEATGDIDLAVLEKGGTLNLVCQECRIKNRSVTVALK
jgi:hypothetical protein